MHEANSLAELIDQLPVEPKTKQQLQEQLKNGDEAGVKKEIHAILVESAELLKQDQDAQKQLPLATAEYKEGLQELEKQAQEIAKGISTDIDAQQLEETRKQLS